ncbi:MAG: hypothetical protein KAG18_07955, partial [Sinobacterium sp.]|nr:hypothetical protein [Sinobacterium sp.]
MLSQLIMGIAGLITKDRECQQFREQHSGQDGLQLIDSIYSYLNFKAVFKAEDLHRIPTTGRLII